MEKGLKEALERARQSREIGKEGAEERAKLEAMAQHQMLESERHECITTEENKMRTQSITSMDFLNLQEGLARRGNDHIHDSAAVLSEKGARVLKQEVVHEVETQEENYHDRTKLPKGYTVEELKKIKDDNERER